jgi:hypothetical protein
MLAAIELFEGAALSEALGLTCAKISACAL